MCTIFVHPVKKKAEKKKKKEENIFGYYQQEIEKEGDKNCSEKEREQKERKSL